MTVLLLLCGLVAVALPGIRPRPLVAASPRWFARLSAVAVAMGLVCIAAALALSAAVNLLLASPASTAGHLAPGGRGGSIVATLLSVWIICRTAPLLIRARSAHKAARADGWLGEHRRTDTHDLVVLPTTIPVAYNVPGRRSQIVISEGLRQQLDEDMLHFVIDHERAHLRAKDRRATVLTLTLEAVVPFLPFAMRTAAAMRVAIERAADEAAAGSEISRRRRLAANIQGVALHVRASCAPEMTQFRARQLAVAPTEAHPLVAAAAAGIALVGASALSVAFHTSGHFAPYLALH
ncbi:M56 family metallopeptidase [Actinomarinicola tropica]|uniref:M48 family metalloprotease n=1 Tax=Actinomarinicola tropica TaxID=2789776 RepID=A0A5Q2RQ41_9ACTN|nr:M56 family metallopeptidase [Actinomarinicola tropica]QGG96247.1 M48 family metalloprotease [Actinomarinicola tropica]